VNIKKSEALVLFYSGESKNSICKRLKIRPRLLKKWIDNDDTKLKDMAQMMYRFKISKRIICKSLFISRKTLDKWLGEYFADLAKHALNKEVELNRKSDGYSFWIDNIVYQ